MGLFPETRAAWKRLKTAWRDYRAAKVERRTIHYTNMTANQKAAFDEAFRHLDSAFEAMRKIKP